MIDLYLVAADEATLAAALPDFRAIDQDGNPCWVTSNHRWSLDLIGPLVVTPAVLGADGQVTSQAVLDGLFHANLRLIDETLADRVPAALLVTPSSPSRVWA